MFYQISLSPQVKQWAIVTYKHGIYELPYQLPNNLPAAHTRKMTQDPRKLGNIRKVPRPDRTISPAPSPQPAQRSPKHSDRTPPAARHPTRKPEPAPNNPQPTVEWNHAPRNHSEMESRIPLTPIFICHLPDARPTLGHSR